MKQQNWKRSFFTIWAGQAVSLITSAVVQMAIILHLTDTTGSAMVLSIATMVGFLPQAVLGTMIGVLVDRWNRKLVMIGADLFIAAAGAILALVTLTMDLPIWVVMVVLFVRSVGTAFHTPALSAATPLLVPEDQLTKCAGYSQSVQSVSYILSPAIGAFLYASWELGAIIALDVVGAIIACITVALIKIPNPDSQHANAESSFIEETKEGYRVFKQSKGLFALLWIGALYALVIMPINALFPLMSMGHFGGTATHVSIVEIVFAVGMLVGGLLLGAWGGFKKRAFSIIFSIALMGISLLISGLLPIDGFVIFVLCSALMGFSSPFYSGVQMALIQEQIEPEYLGRVFGLLGSIMSFAMPFGLILSGIFADQIGIATWFMLSGVGVMGIAILCALIPSIRKL
ncbi:MFS transporter [Paenibacillus sp. SC116]|uniref:MFS transporter n=1 Tax=Paenibacillus sp. SC116 TaxID=2968986 RepID=UPI00215A2D5B|nr:MFS transporter [Paenibacillus sp. SC116]MCR8842374.1 MFS transporter [Paenibacillus sp. SC116]